MTRSPDRSACLALALSLAAALAGCAVPPRPEPPTLRSEAPLAGLVTSDSANWPDADWWTRYGDRQLDDLVARALADTPSLQEARARLDTAVKAIAAARALGGLSSQFNAQVQRQRLSENGLIPPQFLGFTWYNQGDLSAQFKYDFDFWGRTRAAIAAAIDEARAADAERNAAHLMVAAAVTDTYFGWQADQAHLSMAAQTLDVVARNRSLSAKRVERGLEPPDSLHQADAQLASVRELQAGYVGAAKIRQAALAALLGLAPADLPTLAARPLPDVDGTLPANVGLDLVARRADVAASRWRVEAAMRRVDEARAGFYPDISLGAMAGLSSIDLDEMFNAGSRVASIGPALHLPIFGRGSLHAAYDTRRAQLDAAAAQYDATVVDAARDVATQALTFAQVDARRRERNAQLDAVRALESSAAARVRQGVADDRSLLAAQAQVIEQRDALVALDAQALAAQVALTKALGGGYQMEDVHASVDADASTTLERAESR